MKRVSKKSQKPKNLYTGVTVVEPFGHVGELYKKKSLPLKKLKIETYPNMGLVLKDGQQSALAIVKGDKIQLIPQDIRLYQIKARNKEQYIAMNLLMDKDIDFVTLTGCAGKWPTRKSVVTVHWHVRRPSVWNRRVATRLPP